MKCRQCGKELEKKNKKCPHCGYVNSVENLLRKADIPSELDYLTTTQIKNRMRWLNLLSRGRYIILMVIVVVVVGISSIHYFQSRRQVSQVPNFHDDLIENKSSNASGNSVANLVNGGLLLQYGNDLYASDNNGLSKISLTLDKKEVVLTQDATYLNATDKGFYYIDTSDKNTVYLYNVQTKENTKLNIQATQLMVVGDYLYYLEDSSNRAIHQMHKETLQSKKMTQSQCVQFKIIGDWLYFATDSALYQMPVLGGEIMQISDTPYNHFVVDNDYIYYLDTTTGYIWKVKKDNSGKSVVVEEKCSCFLITEHYLYYSLETGGLMKMSRATREVSTLTKDITNRLHVAGTWIYYLTDNGEGRFVSIDENSEIITPVDVISDS